MIGFDSILIYNSHSTDDTQCILDAYAKQGFVERFPQDTNYTDFLKNPGQALLFQDCAQHLKQQEQGHANTWMLTHDVDEFVWFNQTDSSSSSSIQSFRDAVRHLIELHPDTQSIAIPRFLFGSNGKSRQEPGFVMDRFNRRFDYEHCPGYTTRRTTSSSRLLFDQSRPMSYCLENRTHSYDNVKVLSQVSALAMSCVERNLKTAEETKAFCLNPHRHIVGLSNGTTTVTPTPQEKSHDTRYLDEHTVGPHIAIAHYMTKSREEFYQKMCTSDYAKKYMTCNGCNAQTYFDLTETYANNREDTRMMGFSKQLVAFLTNSSYNLIGTHCKTKSPTKHEWKYYEESCLGLIAPP